MCDEAAIVEEVSHPLRFRIALHHCNDVLESLQVLHNEKLSRSLAMSFVREVCWPPRSRPQPQGTPPPDSPACCMPHRAPPSSLVPHPIVVVAAGALA